MPRSGPKASIRSAYRMKRARSPFDRASISRSRRSLQNVIVQVTESTIYHIRYVRVTMEELRIHVAPGSLAAQGRASRPRGQAARSGQGQTVRALAMTTGDRSLGLVAVLGCQIGCSQNRARQPPSAVIASPPTSKNGRSNLSVARGRLSRPRCSRPDPGRCRKRPTAATSPP